MTQGLAHRFRLDEPAGVGRQPGHFAACRLQFADGIDDRLVFQHTGNDVVARLDAALDCQVVGFSRARGPDEIVGRHVEQFGHLPSGQLDRLPCLLAVGVRTGSGITEQPIASHAGEHGLDDLIVYRGRGGVIQVYGKGRHSILTIADFVQLMLATDRVKKIDIWAWMSIVRAI